MITIYWSLPHIPSSTLPPSGECPLWRLEVQLACPHFEDCDLPVACFHSRAMAVLKHDDPCGGLVLPGSQSVRLVRIVPPVSQRDNVKHSRRLGGHAATIDALSPTRNHKKGLRAYAGLTRLASRIVSGLVRALMYVSSRVADRDPVCSIRIRIYPRGRHSPPVEGALAFRHKSIRGKCLRSCPFYRPGSCQIYGWLSDIDPMTFPPVEAEEGSPLQLPSPRRLE